MKTHGSLVSIVIPVYNVADYIGECLDSLLRQTYGNWEALCIDDGSTDSGPTILDNYAKLDCRIKVIHKKNEGTGPARNCGLMMASGVWVVFLDPDDVLGEHAIEEIVRAVINNPNVDFVRYGYTHFDEKYHESRNGNLSIVDISREVPWETLYAYMWEFAYKKAAIDGILAPAFKRGQDRCFLLSVIVGRMSSYLRIESVLYGYRYRPGSSVNKRASVQIMKDELAHRLYCISIIDAGKKNVRYANSGWLEEFCTVGYLRNAEDQLKYSEEEQSELVDYYYKEMPRLRAVKGFSYYGKVLLWLLDKYRCRKIRRLVSCTLPVFLYRVRIVFTQPWIIPLKCVRKVFATKFK